MRRTTPVRRGLHPALLPLRYFAFRTACASEPIIPLLPSPLPNLHCHYEDGHHDDKEHDRLCRREPKIPVAQGLLPDVVVDGGAGEAWSTCGKHVYVAEKQKNSGEREDDVEDEQGQD